MKKDKLGKLLEQIKKFPVSESIAQTEFEKIKLLEMLKDRANDPKAKNQIDEEITKLRESPEFKKNEIQKKLKKICEDF